LNFDEIGFRIGCLRGRVVIVPCDVKAVYLVDPDNRESVTALKCINAVGQVIEPILITKGEWMLEKHFQNNMYDEAKLGASTTGFTNDRLTFAWLEHFHNRTTELAQNRWRVLLMDGHGSHLTEYLKWFC